MDKKITKTKNYKKILDHLINEAPNGVYAKELMDKFNLNFSKVSEIIAYIESRDGLKREYPNQENQLPSDMFFLARPHSHNLLKIKEDKFWSKLLIPSNMIASISLIVSIIALILSIVFKYV